MLDLVKDGENNHEIAERLRISERTVETAITSLCQRLGAKNRAQLVYRAVCEGIISIPPPDATP